MGLLRRDEHGHNENFGSSLKSACTKVTNHYEPSPAHFHLHLCPCLARFPLALMHIPYRIALLTSLQTLLISALPTGDSLKLLARKTASSDSKPGLFFWKHELTFLQSLLRPLLAKELLTFRLGSKMSRIRSTTLRRSVLSLSSTDVDRLRQ